MVVTSTLGSSREEQEPVLKAGLLGVLVAGGGACRDESLVARMDGASWDSTVDLGESDLFAAGNKDL